MARTRKISCPVCKKRFTWKGQKDVVCSKCGHDLKVFSAGYVMHVAPDCTKCELIRKAIAECEHQHRVTSYSWPDHGFRTECWDCGAKGPPKLTISSARKAFEKKFMRAKIGNRQKCVNKS